MQCQMTITPQPLALNPLKDMTQVDEIDYMADFDNLYSRMDDFNKYFNTGKISYNMLKYITCIYHVSYISYKISYNMLIPGLAKIGYQGQLSGTETKRKYADESYKNKTVIKFNVELIANHYTNFQDVHHCLKIKKLTIKIKLVADNDNDIAASVITVNNFFAH